MARIGRIAVGIDVFAGALSEAEAVMLALMALLAEGLQGAEAELIPIAVVWRIVIRNRRRGDLARLEASGAKRLLAQLVAPHDLPALKPIPIPPMQGLRWREETYCHEISGLP